MKNFKIEKPIGYRSGKSNETTFNCMNPDNSEVILRSREWINPASPDFKQENKHNVKSIVQMNRERVSQMKVDQTVEGKWPRFPAIKFICLYLHNRGKGTIQTREVHEGPR